MKKFILDNKLKLVIDDKVLREIYRFDPIKYKHENGGILLGKYNEKDNIYIITDISTTNLKDKKGRYFFIRNKNEAQNVINELWYKSNGEINYLGEWHTHDEINPNPSCIDKKLIKQMIDNKNPEIKNVFMLILGRNKEIYICTLNNRKEIVRLEEE